jgi:CBS domain-containing protein
LAATTRRSLIIEDVSPIPLAAFDDPLSDYRSPAYQNEIQRALAEESVSSIQSQPFIHIRSTAPIRQAVQALHGARASSLLVVEDGKVVGIFTERDVLERVAEQFPKLASRPVREVMTSDPMVVYESDPAGIAVAAIAVAGHRHVPVLKVDATLDGIVSPRRLLHFLERHLEDSEVPA